MDRTSAACAMEWSIDLEKGLRSKKHGQLHEAILCIQQKLEKWDREPAINKAQYNMLGLIPGEDRLFANTILLRLTDAFSSGDKQTKLCVVKVFLSLLRNRKKRSGKHCGLLFKCTPENQLELLRRVKTVFDLEDAESRALSLVLFGCWADMAKDNADIRYLILSSLVSHDVLLMEAALFAGSCFCELSNDFASVLLEILVNLVTSCETLPTVRSAGVQAFAKMGCSSNANKAYKAGLKLVSDSTEEDFLIGMLISLSKLAVRSASLISKQASLLLSYLTQEKPLHLQATALKCLHYVLVKGMSQFPSSSNSITRLINLLDESEVPPALQCGALQIIRKVLLYNLPTIHGSNILESSSILTILENATKSSVMAERLLAIRIIIDILGTFMERKEKAIDGVDCTSLASWLISFVIDQIGLLVKLVLDLHQLDSEMELEVQSSLGLLLLLVQKYSDLGPMVLDKVCLLMEYIASNHNQAMGTSGRDLSGHDIEDVRGQNTIMECMTSNDNPAMGTSKPDLSGYQIKEVRGQNSKIIRSKLLLSIPKMVVACLENLNDAGTVTTRVLDTVETLVKFLQGCSLFDCFTYTAYAFILHSHINYCCMFKEVGENENIDRKLSISLEDYLGQRELLTLKYAENMIERNEYWSAYKVGKYAACQGTWFTAAFIFKHLTMAVQSDSCDQWLKSLSEFANCERNIQLLNLPNNIENLIEACNSLHSSEGTMRAMATSGHALCFQRWFLSLRSRVLESVADMLKLYHVPLTLDNLDNDGQVDGSIVVESLSFSLEATSVLSQISSRLNMLARKFDLILASFRGMDKRSSEIISAHALFCSLLAFSTGLALFFPKLHIENFSGKSEEYLHGVLIQDLVFRLQQVDCEASTKLGSLWRVFSKPKSSFLHSRSLMPNVSCEVRCLLTVCDYAVRGVVALQNEANNSQDVQILNRLTKYGLQLLLDIITKSMSIPFQMPNYFFRVRPCISSELFALNSDTRSQEGISVQPGFHLSLDLCLQLKNIPPDLQLKKLYCILYCQMSFLVPYPEANEGQMQLDYQDWESDDMVYLSDKLLQYVTEETNKFSSVWHRHGADGCGAVNACVFLEPNEKGQGFSTCLLDVSAFPLGRYKIKWHSCFVDKKGSYWSLLPWNAGPVFTVRKNHHED